jgi:phage shock protein PspC (stress-responsive transcriptional regulator)
VVRLIWLLAVFVPFPLLPAILGYFVSWIVMPEAPAPAAVIVTPPPDVHDSAQTA